MDNRRESLCFGLSWIRSPLPVRLVEELSLCELVSEDVRPRPAALVAAIRSSSRTSDLGELLSKLGSRISVNLEGAIV